MTSEQGALLRKAEESLRAARLLFGQSLYNIAVSRAYYTMFYLAEIFLLGEGVALSKHSAVISAFGERFAKAGRVSEEFHRYLIEGQESRNVSDYDTGPGLSRDQAVVQIERAEKFLELGKRLVGSA